MPSSNGSIETLQNVSIKLSETDQEIFFSNLSLEERMLSTGHFSFVWKNEIIDNYTDDQEQFIEEYIGKRITISFEDNHRFEGIILEIHFFQNDGLTQEFNIVGQGEPCRLTWNTFNTAYAQMNLQDTLENVFPSGSMQYLTQVNQPKGSEVHPYIVQSNESDFEFMVHLAIRFGEWYYFDGSQLQFGNLFEEVIELQANADVYHISMSSQVPSMIINASSYDPLTAERITANSENPTSQGLTGALISRSSDVYEDRSEGRTSYIGGSNNQANLTESLRLEMEARTARMITLSARSRHSHLKLGQVIKIISGNKSSEYIIVSINHSSNSNQNYQNDFVAIPKKVKVPHYTNPNWFPRMESHSAIVIDNEDPDGMDRVKVRFIWDTNQSAEDSPWLRIQNPYAGQNRGFRFVPENGDEVMVGFEHGNAEKPYVIGAMFHGQAQTGEDHANNCIKMVGTATNGKLEFNECEHKVTLVNSNEEEKEGILLNKETHKAYFTSKKDNNNMSLIQMHQGQEMIIGIVNGGDTVVQITLDGSGKKIMIDAKMDIEITADQNLKLNAATISLDAQNIKINGTQSIEMKGMEIKAKADTTLELEGLQSTFKGNVSADVKGLQTTVSGDAITTIKGGVVMIN